MGKHFFVSYVEKGEKPFTTSEIENTTVSIDTSDITDPHDLFMGILSELNRGSFRDMAIISISEINF